MSSGRIVEFDLDAVTREGAIPARFITDADGYYEIVDVRNDAGDFFAIRQSDGGGRRLEIGVKHVGLEFDGGIFFRDAREISFGRMAILAAAGSFEEGMGA